jgi:large subunit ribosomal protein L6
MSKIGRIPVQIKDGTTVTISNNAVTVNGTKGTMSFSLPDGIEVKQEEGKLVVSQKDPSDYSKRALFGLTRAMLANIVTGVSTGFEKKLELSGVGYRAQVNGRDLQLSIGFSHPVIIKAVDGIAYSVKDNIITVAGSDKAVVGDWAAKIRSIRPPEPYKGKGILYVGERIRRKAGKAAKAVGGAK